METPDLLASCWTSAGNARPLGGDERSPETIQDRIDAVAAAGFTSMGLTHADVVALRDSVGLVHVAAYAAERKIAIAELEMVMDWYEVDDAELRKTADRVRDDLVMAADELGARHIKAGCDYLDREWAPEHLAREFGRLAAIADSAGLRVALEPQAFCHIKTPEHALRLIEAAGTTSAGLCIDIWHLERIGYPLAQLAGLPSERLICIEINDASAEPRGSLIEDTVTNRKLPGKGDFDLPAFIRAICAAGFTGAWGVEILSDELRAYPLLTALREAFESTASVFAAID